jgi:hypothetical protein
MSMPAGLRTISQVLRMTVSVLSPRKSIFSRPEVADRPHGVLGDDGPVLVPLEREQVDQRLVADDDAGGVDGGVAVRSSSTSAFSTVRGSASFS